MIEQVTHEGVVLAILLRAEYKTDGVEFFTPHNFSQQLGYMNREKGYKVVPHTHKTIEQTIVPTHEVLFVKSGKAKVFIYNNAQQLVAEKIMNTGDIILLVCGGHAVEMLEDTELIEIRQGPFDENSKVIFTPTIKV